MIASSCVSPIISPASGHLLETSHVNLSVGNPWIPGRFAHANLQIADTTAPLEFFAKNGYYIVKDKIYRHKLYAMQAATKLGLGPKGLTWIFNDRFYSALDWQRPSRIPLTTLYRMRAQQLRDKYDYLMLMFSGGADSTTALHSFVLNNIHLDEVVVSWPVTQTAGRYNPSESRAPENFSSEWDYAIRPRLKWLEANFPRIKITILDTMAQLDAQEDREDTATITMKHTYNSIQRGRDLDNLVAERQRQHPNSAAVVGVDSPIVYIVGSDVYSAFIDTRGLGWASDYTLQGLERNVEYFFWSPDLPELPLEQAHVILDHVNHHPASRAFLPAGPYNPLANIDMRNHSMDAYRLFIKPLLYPTFDPKIVQVDKNPDELGHSRWFHWFYDNPHSTDVLVPWESAIRAEQNLIHEDFFFRNEHGRIINYRFCWSLKYKLGSLIQHQ